MPSHLRRATTAVWRDLVTRARLMWGELPDRKERTMRNKAYWRAVLERAIKTAAQVAVLTLGGDAVDAFNLDWQNVLGLTLGGFILSILTSLASSGLGGDEGPALGGTELLPTTVEYVPLEQPPVAPPPEDGPAY